MQADPEPEIGRIDAEFPFDVDDVGRDEQQPPGPAVRRTAEGVELPLQVTRLNELGCGMAQGFHLARPCEADAMEALLSKGGLDPGTFAGTVQAPRAPAKRKPSRSRRVPSTGAPARNSA